uniref:Uncharacterized protein n=1 Tax=Anguilla anguilla TaxID=7936 RepID=A0A0E9PP45_ANGAN
MWNKVILQDLQVFGLGTDYANEACQSS